METVCQKYDTSSSETCWYVMRAYKNEAKAEQVLSDLGGLPFFIPKRYVVHTCRGKKMRVLVPAINSLVFLYASRLEIKDLKSRYPFFQYVMWRKSTGLEYLKVPIVQMEAFMKVASHYEKEPVYYRPDELRIQGGTHVRVIGGDFDGVEGYFVKLKGKRNRRLVIQLDGITTITAEVQADLLQIIP